MIPRVRRAIIKKAVRYEQCLAGWTRLHDRYLIAGHSHRPRLPENGELYLNAGSCVHPGCITAIELEQMQMIACEMEGGDAPGHDQYVVREKLADRRHFVGKTRFFKKII